MHVVLHVTVRQHAGARCDRFALRDAGGADDVLVGQGEGDVVAAEVGVELRVQVKFVGIPARRRGPAFTGQLQHGDFREPLRHQVERAEVPGAGDDAGQLRLEIDVEQRGGAGRDRRRQIELQHGVVARAAAIGLHVRPRCLGARLQYGAQRDVAPFAVPDFGTGRKTALGQPLLREEGAVIALERIHVHVQVNAAHRHGTAVAPAELLLAVDAMLDGVERGLNAVTRHAVRQCRFLSRAHATPGARRRGNAHRRCIRRGQRNAGLDFRLRLRNGCDTHVRGGVATLCARHQHPTTNTRHQHCRRQNSAPPRAQKIHRHACTPST
jgi:hypothetical protein